VEGGISRGVRKVPSRLPGEMLRGALWIWVKMGRTLRKQGSRASDSTGRYKTEKERFVTLRDIYGIEKRKV